MKRNSTLLLVTISVLSIVILIVGCSGSGKTTTQPPGSPSTSGSQTFDQLANVGTAVFADQCASCHGNHGQGGDSPALIGSNAHLSKYATAQGLLNFISTAMPASAPGTLSHEQYLQVLGFLLVQNQEVNSGDLFTEGGLNSITLK